jgi:hypothetical protein
MLPSLSSIPLQDSYVVDLDNQVSEGIREHRSHCDSALNWLRSKDIFFANPEEMKLSYF